MKKILVVLLCVILCFPIAACAGSSGSAPIVEMEMADGGIVRFQLDPGAAPVTVENFLGLVNDGFYDGLIFHRVIEGFMVQGGDPTGQGNGGADDKIEGEFAANGHDNPISHNRGVVSMARSGNDYNSASSQFFIVHEDSTFLDGQYAAFGKVTEGMDVVDAIASVETGENDRPAEDVVIASIRVVG
jgi:peptidyl-prolyl cis-trans isomerase B (cyclophilin B)